MTNERYSCNSLGVILDANSTSNAVDDFFARNNLPPAVRDECLAYAQREFADASIHEAPTQGYCSYTIIIGSSQILQFRPRRFRLDLQITSAANVVHGSYAPVTSHLTTLYPWD